MRINSMLRWYVRQQPAADQLQGIKQSTETAAVSILGHVYADADALLAGSLTGYMPLVKHMLLYQQMRICRCLHAYNCMCTC
jgi:hypothetical protein